ncbi:PTS transporter subunit EIIC [Clostridium botulinum]|uniref:N-acetylglucosamine-specific PTS transporter subunit IIBC n=1 Tax=Clostridium botulinum TaxID=1491 RepID=UPI00174EBE83|nr:N-acetylglucosamine-specific PTS transporter subunit IIBC [Clostridium botulinum]MBD5638432.1 PTS transporter subunit EIIC [Clostridium botulinum]
MAKNSKILSKVQKLGKSLMTPIAVLPAAALLLRLGQPDIWSWVGSLPSGIPWMSTAGAAIFDNLSLIFAIGIAVGLAEENNGVAAISATVGFLVLTEVSLKFDDTINMGVLSGIIVGILSASLYNKYKNIKLPDYLGFFGGKRFVPIITSLYSLILGIISGFVWPPIQNVINNFGNAVAGAGAIGAFFFGLFNRLLIPTGLHHILNTIFWFQFGTFKSPSGTIANGDLKRFFAGDPTAGTYMTGFFVIMMFALPAACFAMVKAAREENKKAVSGMLLGLAFTAFLTGVTEPIEFTFMFISPVLYAIHALLTGIALALTSALGIKCGFGFSASLIDYGLNFGISTKPLFIIPIGLIFAAIYYFLFLFFIKKFNLPTPGRELDSEVNTNINVDMPKKSGHSKLEDKAKGVLNAIGNSENIDSIDACVTRIRLVVFDGSKINEAKLKELGANGIMKLDDKNFQIVVGTIADPLVSQMKLLMKK